MKRLLAISALAALALSGCSADTADTVKEKPAAAAPEEAAPEETPVETEAPEEATAFGTPVTVGDWVVTLNSWNPNADAAVFEESEGDNVPEKGKH